MYYEAYWILTYKYSTEYEIYIATRYGLSYYIKYKIKDKIKGKIHY